MGVTKAIGRGASDDGGSAFRPGRMLQYLPYSAADDTHITGRLSCCGGCMISAARSI